MKKTQLVISTKTIVKVVAVATITFSTIQAFAIIVKPHVDKINDKLKKLAEDHPV